MSKVIRDTELAQIIHQAVCGDLIDCADQYQHFIEDIGALVATHFGAEVVTVSSPMEEGDEGGWAVHFMATECTPQDGGVFKEFDKDVTVIEWFREAQVKVG